MDLLHEITRCPNIQHCYATSQSTHPCATIIRVQKEAHLNNMDQHQVPVILTLQSELLSTGNAGEPVL